MQLAVKPQRVKILLSQEMTTRMAEVSSVGSGFQISDRELHHIKEILQTTQSLASRPQALPDSR